MLGFEVRREIPMANTREIKLRIKGINETKKITKAMKLISASKLKKARALLNETLPFFEKVQDTIDDILAHTEEFTSVYLDHRPNKPNKKKAYIVIASDKGLTGGYNHNLLKYAEDMMEKENSMRGCSRVATTSQSSSQTAG